MKARPILDRIIIIQDPAENRVGGKFELSDTAKERPKQGIVVAVGPGKLGEPMVSQIGDKVQYGEYAGVTVTIEGEEYIILKEGDLLLIL